VLNVSNATTKVNKLLGVHAYQIVQLGLSLGYSAANCLVPQILAHEDAKTQLSVVNDELVHHPVTSNTSLMTSHRILITAEYLNAHFFSVFLFVYALQVLKALFYANFRKLG